MEEQFFNDPESIRDTLDLKNQAVDAGALASDVLANLDDLREMKSDSDIPAEYVDQFLGDPNGVREILDLKEDAIVAGAEVQGVLQNVEEILSLKTEYGDFPDKMEIVLLNSDKASQLRELNDQLSGKADEILTNVGQLDVIGDLVEDFEDDPVKMDVVFANADKAGQIRDLND